MGKTYFKYDKKAEENGLNIEMHIDFYTSENGEKMQLCNCTLSNGCQSIDYAWVIGETTLKDVINDFLNR